MLPREISIYLLMQQLERAARMAQQPRLHLLPMLLLLLLPLMSPGLVLPAAASVCAPADRDALLSFKAEVEDRAGALGSWDPAQSCCGWAGVACDPAGRVTEVRIDDEEEEGAATGAAGEWWLVRRTGPAAAPDAVGRTLGRIATLRVLKLARTDLRGDSLPRAAWPQLRVVALRGLNLRGGVPRQWGGWRQVREVNVRGGNALAGGLPPELCRLANLQVLQLSGKAGSGGGGLTGPVPPCLLALPNLKALVLSFNRLSGPVPAPAPGGRLEVLRLDHNRLRGGVPEALGSLPKLKVRPSGSNRPALQVCEFVQEYAFLKVNEIMKCGGQQAEIVQECSCIAFTHPWLVHCKHVVTYHQRVLVLYRFWTCKEMWPCRGPFPPRSAAWQPCKSCAWEAPAMADPEPEMTWRSWMSSSSRRRQGCEGMWRRCTWRSSRVCGCCTFEALP